MILLLGGTSETAPLALGLAQAGYRVLISKATTVALEIPAHPRIQVRCGALDVSSMTELCQSQSVCAIVDAAHPYARAAHATARQAAAAVGIQYFEYCRPATEESAAVVYAADHAEAARLAAEFGRPILLTTGSRNLAPYVQAAVAAGVPLIARVLPESDSLAACRRAGISAERIVAGRGPFSIEENRNVLRRFSIGVLVTKDGGAAGGVPEKLQAAQAEGCPVVMLRRPQSDSSQTIGSAAELLQRLATTISPDDLK